MPGRRPALAAAAAAVLAKILDGVLGVVSSQVVAAVGNMGAAIPQKQEMLAGLLTIATNLASLGIGIESIRYLGDHPTAQLG